MQQKASALQDSYDRLAAEYARRIYAELQHKPFDRQMLDSLIAKVNHLGPICDMGCGPGQIARYLHDHGANVIGIDLSTEMVKQARMLNPGITFTQGNMLDLSGVADSTWGGIAGFYSIIHIPRDDVQRALAEFKRVLIANGVLLLTFHIGQEVRHIEELWGEKVSMDFIFFEREELTAHLRQAGFVLEEALERDPYPDVEVQTRRGYIFARKPAQA